MNTELGTVETAVNNQVHIFFEGRAWDLDFEALDIGMLSSDNEVRNKVAEALDVPVIKLANFSVIPNHATQDLNMTPQATFGS